MKKEARNIFDVADANANNSSDMSIVLVYCLILLGVTKYLAGKNGLRMVLVSENIASNHPKHANNAKSVNLKHSITTI